MAGSETQKHRELKCLALAWAQQHGYRVAAAEVTAPQLGARLDVAAYRPPRRQEDSAGTGTTIIFECKQSRADFFRDARCATQIAARLATLHERRTRYEETLRQYYPSLRNAETLFAEFDSYRFEAAGDEWYDKLVRELRTLSARLHAQTKFAQLIRWRAANLHYVIAEAGVARPHELPHGWGLLVREGDHLHRTVEPTWQPATEQARAALLLRIAIAGTRAVHQNLGLAWALPEPGRRPRAADAQISAESR